MIFQPWLGNSFVSENTREFYAFHFLECLQICAYLITWSKFSLLHNSPWIPFHAQSCLILNFFCDRQMHSLTLWLIVSLFFLITYTYYSVAYYRFLISHNWSLWRCFVLLVEELLSLSWDFHSVVMSMSSWTQSQQFVSWNIHTVISFPLVSFLLYFCLVLSYQCYNWLL